MGVQGLDPLEDSLGEFGDSFAFKMAAEFKRAQAGFVIGQCSPVV